jgi:ribosomal-protein-alanine N-acetyltransferase
MIISMNEFNLRNAQSSDRSKIASLIHFGSYIHQHLDWQSPIDLIGRKPFLVIDKDQVLTATLACPPDLLEFAWVRLFATSIQIKLVSAWNMLWEATLDEFLQNGNSFVAALSMHNWFNSLLEGSKFVHSDNVIVLMNESTTKIRDPNMGSINIRRMMIEDIPKVMDIDSSSFDLEWRNSFESLELAFHQSAYTTIAELDGEIIGYQFSTSSGIGGHLARLAVTGVNQGKGVGYYLVHDVINHFKMMHIMNVTVNTQESNTASLALYANAGFKSTGESYRVYKYIL